MESGHKISFNIFNLNMFDYFNEQHKHIYYCHSYIYDIEESPI